MVAFDQVERRALGCCIAAGEREDELVQFLLWLKSGLKDDPRYFTIDFNPPLEAAIKQVFPRSQIIICTFHAHQLLTRALLRELNRLGRKEHGQFIKECRKLMRATIDHEKGKNLRDMAWLVHEECQTWLEFYYEIEALCTQDDLASFTSGLESLIIDMGQWDEGVASNFKERLWKKRPTKGFTEKSIVYFKPELKKRWRSVLRDIRGVMETKKKFFSKGRYLLLKKPENLSKNERMQLRDFLKQHPWARKYRKVIRRFYALFSRDGKGTPDLGFLSAIISEDSHDWLKAAVNTLQTRVKEVFNYRSVPKSWFGKNIIPAIRVNPEFVMRKVNNVNRTQFGFRSDKSARLRVSHLLKCPVFISSAVND